jgi:hypothetical protein
MHFGGRKFSDWIRKVLAAEAIANKILSQVFHSRQAMDFLGIFDPVRSEKSRPAAYLKIRFRTKEKCLKKLDYSSINYAIYT